MSQKKSNELSEKISKNTYNSITFRIPCTPPTHTQQERKISWKQHRTYLDPKAKKDRQRIIDCIADTLNGPSEERARYPNGVVKPIRVRDAYGFPWDEAVELRIRFVFGTKDKKKSGYKSTKPDLDNLLKSILDSLQIAGVITNDSRVVRIEAEKYWCRTESKEGIELVLKKMDTN